VVHENFLHKLFPRKSTPRPNLAGFIRSRIQFNPGIAVFCLPSFDHLIRPQQHVRRDRQADLLGCLEIDHELELRRLLDR
jgi:hypothetical protein